MLVFSSALVLFKRENRGEKRPKKSRSMQTHVLFITNGNIYFFDILKFVTRLFVCLHAWDIFDGEYSFLEGDNGFRSWSIQTQPQPYSGSLTHTFWKEKNPLKRSNRSVLRSQVFCYLSRASFCKVELDWNLTSSLFFFITLELVELISDCVSYFLTSHEPRFINNAFERSRKVNKSRVR